MFAQSDDRLITLPMRPGRRDRLDRDAERKCDQAPLNDGAGLTVEEFARRYRVGADKVRGWIDRGEVRAINTAATLCGRSRWIIPPEAVAAFEAKRAGGPPPVSPKRRRRKTAAIDFFPD
jgi:hypothetical protein